MALDTPWSDRPWQHVLVYGLGLSGRAAAHLLLTRGVAVTAVDGRDASALALGELADAPGFSLLAGGEAAPLPDDVDAVVLSPGVPPERPLLAAALDRDLPVISEVELAAPFLDGEVVGITGSNGKSTTTALTGALLAAQGYDAVVCGNIGVPLCAVVPRTGGGSAAGSAAGGSASGAGRDPFAPLPHVERQRVYVVELSSFQLERVATFHARAAALLNVSPDHLDRYPSLDAYAAAKRNVFRTQTPGDVAVLNGDDDYAVVSDSAGRRRSFSRRHLPMDGCGVAGDIVFERGPDGERELFWLADLGQLEGVHNLENAMAAALLARAFAVAPSAIRAGLTRFVPLPHRMAAVASARGVTWYDDSKGTNVAATAASLEGFADHAVHLVLGGRNKGADFRYLRDAVRRKVARLYLIGESAGDLAAALGDLVPCDDVGTLAAAVARADEQATAGDVVLLSPACASFDQFRDYHHRGEEFRRLVADRLGDRPAGPIHPAPAGEGA